MDSFEDPSSSRTADPFSDYESTLIFAAFIQPCILHVGTAMSARNQISTYEFYHPSFCARQLGFGQLSIRLRLAERVLPRQTVTCAQESIWLRDIDRDIPVGELSAFNFQSTTSMLFRIRWSEWKKHMFGTCTNRHVNHLNLLVPIPEVNAYPFIFP